MENNIQLNTKEIFSFAFTSAKKHFAKFFVVVLALMVLTGISPEEVNGPVSALLSLISVVGSVYLNIAVYAAVFKILSGQEVSMSDMFAWPKNGFKMLWANILTGLTVAPLFILAFLVGAGSLFSTFAGSGAFSIILGLVSFVLIILALYVGVRIMFAKYYALDTGHGAVESIKYSWDLTKNRFAKLLGLNILMGFVVLLGLLALFIGLFWAIPTVLIAQVLIYKKLSGSIHNPVEVIGSSILPEAQPLELEASPSVIDVQK